MIINHKYKFVFVHIPKTGGTSMTLMLSKYIDKTLPTEGHGWQRRFHKDSMHSTLKPYPSNYFSFGFMRNPWDWLVSIYHSGCNVYCGKICNFKNFDEFVDVACKKGKSQLDWLIVDNASVKYIAKFEDYEDECKYIFDTLKLPMPSVIPHRLNNTANRDNYRKWYSDELAEKVAKSFANDISHFNYQF